jgi:ATPase family associated with various cellular activities (AAA)
VSEQPLSPAELAEAFVGLSHWAQRTAPRQPSPFHSMLTEHLGANAAGLPVTGESVPAYDWPNLQLALDAYLEAPGRSAEIVGLVGMGMAAMGGGVPLALLVEPGPYGEALKPGPVDYFRVELERGRSIACIRSGLLLISSGDERLAVLVGRAEAAYGGQGVRVDVMSAHRESAERFVRELRELMEERNVYRGKVISLEMSQGPRGGELTVTFHELPQTERARIVFPEGLLERIERNTLTFARKANELLAAGRHLRRGILLHGPPGTGKTLTVRYLASALEERTILLLTGGALGLIGPSCALAQRLQPSTVVVEDVDLIAQQRTAMPQGVTTLLFELLNEMDGLADDADVMFVLTTNRADLLEPALAARPGRVDLAIELPLPDAASRRRLLELFGEGLETDGALFDGLVERTEGASPAFLRELVRKAALLAAEADATVTGDHVERALSELEEGGRLTRSILGSGPPAPGVPGS